MRQSPGLTVKQQRFADALIAGATTVTDAAKQAGVSRSHAHRIRQAATVQDYIAAAKESQGNSARSLAEKSLNRAHSALDRGGQDPITDVQLAAGGITVAAKHAESFGDSTEQLNQDEQRISKLALRCSGAAAALRFAKLYPHRIDQLLTRINDMQATATAAAQAAYLRDK